MLSHDGQNTILTAALRAHAHGCSVVRVRNDGQKRPVGSWDQYQSQPADETTVKEWFPAGTDLGLGIVTGAVSGNVEMFELEGRAMEGLPQVIELLAGVGLTEVWQRISQGWVEQSPSGGVHYFYRIDGAPVPGNQKVAQASRENGSLTLAETRGEGGFVVVAPSSGTVHPTGQPWVLTSGGPHRIPTITWAERESLLALFKIVLDEREEEQEAPRSTGLAAMWQSETTGAVSPGDDFEAKTSWEQILEPEGWTIAYVDQGTTYWCRPGKTEGQSATTGHADDRDRLFVFSSSTVFPTETPITKFHAYAVLHHNGDHTAAAADLASQGFGHQPSPQERAEQAGPVANWRDHGFTAADVYVDSGNSQRISPSRLAFCVNPDQDLARGSDELIWRYDSGRYIPDDEVIKTRVVQTMGDFYQVRLPPLARDMVLHSPDFPVLPDDAPDSRYINIRNGMFEWSTGNLLPHDKAYRSLVQLPVSYNPEATCPTFDRWLESVVGEEHVLVLWEVLAYSVLFGNPLQKAAMLYGEPQSGKGTFLRVLERVLGKENTTNVTVQGMTSRFDPALLYGKVANIVGDAEANYLPDTAAFKRIVAGDRITAEHKGKPGFSFEPWAFHILATNKLPPTSDSSGGFLRRWLIVPFKGTIAADPNFHEAALWAEADGIFTKAVKELPRLIGGKKFTQTLAMADALIEMAEQSDVVLEWLNTDAGILMKDPSMQDLRAKLTDAFAVYRHWASETGHKNVLSSKTLWDRLDRLGYTKKTVKGTRMTAGLQVDNTVLADRWRS
jgi:putative DNA primase/helicase